MKRRMEVSQHCWKFIYKHSDISIFAVYHLFYFFVIFFICTGMGKIFLQINSAAVAFIDILIAAWEGLRQKFEFSKWPIRTFAECSCIKTILSISSKQLKVNLGLVYKGHGYLCSKWCLKAKQRYEPRHKKTCFQSLRLGRTQTGLCSYRE